MQDDAGNIKEMSSSELEDAMSSWLFVRNLRYYAGIINKVPRREFASYCAGIIDYALEQQG